MDSSDILQIAGAWNGSQLVLRLSGELDSYTAPQLEHALDEAAARSPSEVSLDLESLTFMDAAGIRAILTGTEIFGRRLILHRTPPNVMRVFTIAGVEQRMNFGIDSGSR